MLIKTSRRYTLALNLYVFVSPVTVGCSVSINAETIFNLLFVVCLHIGRFDIAKEKKLLWQKVFADIKSSACLSATAMTMIYKGMRFLMDDLEQSGVIPQNPMKNLPETYKTTERTFGLSQGELLFDEYFLCQNFHHHKPHDLVDKDGRPLGDTLCAQQQFGKPCRAEIFNHRPSGKVSPKLVHCYRGIIDGLRPFLHHSWFLEGLEEYNSMPEFEEEVHYEYFNSTRLAEFQKQFLKLEPDKLKVLIIPSGDWYVPRQN